MEDFELNLKEIRKAVERTEQRQLAAAIDEKKKKYLNLPNISFHYADKDRIRNFYNDYFREPTVENIVSEIANEVSGDIKSSLPQVLEAKAGGKDLSKWISTLKLPDTSLNGMFHRYQRETIKNNQVVLGLELVDVELSDLEKFDKLVRDLNEYGVEIAEDKLAPKRESLKEKAAETTLVKLEQATGWVIIEGSFRISESGEFYRCTYKHPLSDYVLALNKTVTISVSLPKSSIETHVAGNYAQSVGKVIPLRIYGEVWQPISREFDTWDFQITPLAVY